MRSVGFWLLFIMPLLALLITSESAITTVSNDDVVVAINHEESMSALSIRKLKERSFEVNEYSVGKGLGGLNEDDYPRIDPSPSSKAAVHFGPIEHGAPLMPYIPRATPPSHPKHGPP